MVAAGLFSLFLGAAVPPWVGYNEEETIQQQILALSAVSVTAYKVFSFYIEQQCASISFQEKFNFSLLLHLLTGQKKFLARSSCRRAISL